MSKRASTALGLKRQKGRSKEEEKKENKKDIKTNTKQWSKVV
jgi:hypothetical protein